MRTKNLILSTALIALTTSAFGQFSSFRDRVLQNRNDESPFKTAEYTGRTSQFKAFLSDAFTLESNEQILDVAAEPVVLECYIINNIDISYQEEVNVESWMAEPFDSNETLELEGWMSEPFKRDDALTMENWMTAPFVNSEVIPVERWMTQPFATEEMIELERWMATSWQ